MKSTFFIIQLLLINAICYTQETKGIELINNEEIKNINTKNPKSNISITKNDAGLYELLVESLEQPKFIYNLSTNIPLNKSDYNKGRVFLLSFKAKTVTASLETGEAKAVFILNQTNDYKGYIDVTQSISSDWQTYYIPYKANQNIKKENLGVTIHYGYKPQSFLLKDISFKVFPEGTPLKSLPKTKIVYTGMEPNAQWRVEANKRIEAIRKGNFTLNVSNNGKPLENIKVQITLKEHAFPFGAMLKAKNIINDKTQYKNFKDLFNLTVLGNDLKIKGWANRKNRPTTLKALELLQKDKITTKGHVLMWPGFNYNTKEVKENKKNPEKVKEIVRNHINSILEGTKGKISHWDVVNETYTNRDFQNIMGGEEFLYEAFEIAKKKAPYAKRFTNEYGIISKGGIDTKKQKWYYDYIKRVDENTGNAIQGIGIQSHIGSDLTPPEKVFEVLGYYATLGKQISISEFTMDIKEPKIREQYTRDFMIAVFSHPNVSEFMFWGFKEDKKGKVDIYTKNNEIGAMGKAYLSLVYKDWKTSLNAKTDTKGSISSRGFYGFYEYTILVKGKEVVGTFQVKPKNKNVIKINLN